VTCGKFILDRWMLSHEVSLGGDDRFHIVSVIEGELCIGASLEVTLRRGQTALLPACLAAVAIGPRGKAVALDMYSP
jgi:mannose-6-phosphate isomerase class I